MVEAGMSSPFGLWVRLEKDGQPVQAAAVTYEVYQSAGGLLPSSNLQGVPQSTIQSTTDAQGYAGCQFRAPLQPAYCWIKATTAQIAPVWFLMIVGGGDGAFPSNPSGVDGVDYAEDSDGDGDTDAEELAAGNDPKNPSSHSPDWTHWSLVTHLHHDYDQWSASNSREWQSNPNDSSTWHWFGFRASLLQGVLYHPGPEDLGTTIKPPVSAYPVLNVSTMPPLLSPGWQEGGSAKWTSQNAIPTTVVAEWYTSAGESDGVTNGQLIPSRSWAAQALKVEIKTARARPYDQNWVMLVQQGLTEKQVIEARTLTIPAGSSSTGPIVIYYPPVLEQYNSYSISLLPVEVKVVNRDDPAKTWTTGPVTAGSRAYTSPTIPEVADVKNGDLISWSVPGLTGGSFQWWATGPSGSRKDAPSSVTTNEWKLEDPLDWLPGKWRVHCRYTPSGGAATEFDFEQDLGYRSPDIMVIGWIDGAQIILPSGSDIVPGQGYHGWDYATVMHNLVYRLGFMADLAALSGNTSNWTSPHSPDGGRRYVNAWLIKDTPNGSPPASFTKKWGGYPDRFIVDEDGVTNFRNDSTKFRSFHRFQARFELDDSGKIKGKPVYLIPPIETTKVGATPTNWLGSFPPDPGGETGPHDREINTTGVAMQFNPKNGKTHKAKLGDDFEQYTQGRISTAGAFLSKRLNNLNVPWIWSIIEFGAANAKAGTIAVPEHEIFPVYHVYYNGKRLDTLTNSISEAKLEEFIQLGAPIAP